MNMESLLLRQLDALGLPAIIPEPEVTRRALAKVKSHSLASLLARLINQHEPMLRAECDGANLTVREIGDDYVMQCTVLSHHNVNEGDQ